MGLYFLLVTGVTSTLLLQNSKHKTSIEIVPYVMYISDYLITKLLITWMHGLGRSKTVAITTSKMRKIFEKIIMPTVEEYVCS